MFLNYILGSNIAQYGDVSNLVYIVALVVSNSMLLAWQNGKIQQKFSPFKGNPLETKQFRKKSHSAKKKSKGTV